MRGTTVILLAVVITYFAMLYFSPDIETEYETTVLSEASIATSGNGCVSLESFTSIVNDDGTRRDVAVFSLGDCEKEESDSKNLDDFEPFVPLPR